MLSDSLSSLEKAAAVNLAPAASAAALKALAKAFGRPLHEEVGALLAQPLTALVEGALAEELAQVDAWWLNQEWLDAAAMRGAYGELRKQKNYRASLMPIATDGAGNYTCHDAETGKLFDWDHERASLKGMRDSLEGVVKKMATLLSKQAHEAKAATSLPAAATLLAALPKKVREAKVPWLRKFLSPWGKHADVSCAAMSSDAEVIVACSTARNALFGSLKNSAEFVPTEPTIRAQQERMGFVTVQAEGFSFSSDGALAWRLGHELRLWRWAQGELVLEARGVWNGSLPPDDATVFLEGRPFCTRTHLAQLAWRDTGLESGETAPQQQRVVGVWELAKLPRTDTLEGTAPECAPGVEIDLKHGRFTDLHLSEKGVLLVLESPAYLESVVSAFDVTGKQLAQCRLELDLTAGVALENGGFVVTTADGELITLDASLKETGRQKSHQERVVSVRGGEGYLVSSSQHELVLSRAVDLSVIGRVKVDGLHDFRIETMTPNLVLTNNPLRLFTLERS